MKNIKGMGAVADHVAKEVGIGPQTISLALLRERAWHSLAAENPRYADRQAVRPDALVSLKNRVEEYETKNWPTDDQEDQIRKTFTPKFRALWNQIVASIDVEKFRAVYKEYSELASEEGREVLDRSIRSASP